MWQAQSRARALRCAALLVGLGLACAIGPDPTAGLRYALFEPISDDEVFAPAISHWQAELRLETLTREATALRGELRGEPIARHALPTSPLGRAYLEFQSHARHQIVSDVVAWVQLQSGLYYAPDGSLDDWPVLRDLLDRGADDCDGMDLMTFSLLREFGLGPGDIYRAIVRNRQSHLHHVVTLWFAADQRDDPWLLDSTGEISRALRPLSSVPDWEPLVLFDETTVFAVRAHP